MAHPLVSSSYTICNSPSPLVADIVYFDSLYIAVSLTILKRVYKRKNFTSLQTMFRSPLQLIWNLTFFDARELTLKKVMFFLTLLKIVRKNHLKP